MNLSSYHLLWTGFGPVYSISFAFHCVLIRLCAGWDKPDLTDCADVQFPCVLPGQAAAVHSQRVKARKFPPSM